MSSSHCIFCATPTSPSGGGGSVEDQFQVIFLLRNILGLSKDKLTKLVGGEINCQLHPDVKIRVCRPCGEEVKRSLEAVKEIVKLRKKITKISAGLKEHIFETRGEKGEGKDSVWGQIRLDVLLAGACDDESASNHHLSSVSDCIDENQSDEDCMSISSFAADEEPFPITEFISNGVEKRNVSSHLDFGEVGGQQGGVELSNEDNALDPIFEDPLIEVEEKVLVQPLSTSEENKNHEESILTNFTTLGKSTRRLKRNSLNQSETGASSSPVSSENESDSEVSLHRKQESAVNSEKRRRQPDGLYHCLFCSKKFASSSARQNHHQVHLQKYVCKICNRSYSYARTFAAHLSKICERPIVTKHPCKYCGKKFPNLSEHAKSCGSRKQKRDVTWKQYLK